LCNTNIKPEHQNDNHIKHGNKINIKKTREDESPMSNTGNESEKSSPQCREKEATVSDAGKLQLQENNTIESRISLQSNESTPINNKQPKYMCAKDESTDNATRKSTTLCKGDEPTRSTNSDEQTAKCSDDAKRSNTQNDERNVESMVEISDRKTNKEASKTDNESVCNKNANRNNNTMRDNDN